ncbi:uncharacterized protein [Paralichthys olivaceus]|uniref:uncharacterized protein n=1 Tax=Paralichthys olivaceus TaxID=8255 RepID=UPI00375373A1
MMRKGEMKCVTLYMAVGFIVTCYLAQTANCHRPKETGKRRGTTLGVQEGTIVFGREADSHVANGKRKAPPNAYAVEDERAYQADSAGWSEGQAQENSPREASWKRMAPSLQCGGNQMKFRAVGPGVSQFAVEQGNEPPMPLSQVPSTCGYTMLRNSFALVMLVPYDACSMVQEGGSYVLPMRWQGIPVSLWCPKPAATPSATTPAPATTSAKPQDPVPQTLKSPPSYPHVPVMPPNSMNQGVPQSYLFAPYWGYPQYPSVVVPQTTMPTTTTAEPTTTTTSTKKPEMPKIPQYPSFFPPNYAYFAPLSPVTTAAPKTVATSTTKLTTTVKPVAKDPNPMFQYPAYPPFYPPNPWPLPGPLPTAAETTTTTPQTTTTQPTTTQSPLPQLPQFPKLPQFPPYGPLLPQFPPYGPQVPPFPPFGPFPPYPFPQFVPPFGPNHQTTKPL